MILLISPAKSLDYDPTKFKKHSLPTFAKEIKELVGVMKKKSSSDIRSLMHVSEKIADLNVERFKNFKSTFNETNAKQALLAFNGDVYTGMNTPDFNAKDLAFAQKHLRILSGLYGILKPMDLMQPYRLEMGTKLETKKGNNLYEFWGDKVTKEINLALKENKDDIIINLASKEYFKVIKPKALEGKVFNMHFKELRDGKYKIISFSAKKARGMMCNYVIKNKIKKVEDLKGFDQGDYVFNPELSTPIDYTFTR